MPRWHEGRTCQQFQEMISTNNKSEQWISQNTRKCGSCRAPFFKLDGCNHLQCGACKKDLCNLCGETFPDASTTYSHLRARHGGYFTAA
ncbi:hypothetical protein DUNSADRAFT_11573 [Dunaliella salina]|uniref:RING-type domain-containing protein n=1 Tax=Dunaliella salina TaxID=3046 RepID=A0ABQ7FRR8_DUNSA|nr:hypothetical protein DUNSADRAFT_11573 [Dunaliella salina]|eukprot:KAF5825331.1 hypothetical protein DUNSADRAFT_11573 [Dunaliella salina]